MNKNESTPGWLSWVIIGILMVSGCWFIALPWLFIKLFGPDKRKSERRQAPPLNYRPAQNQSVNSGSYFDNDTQTGKSGGKLKETLRSFIKSPDGGTKNEVLLIAAGALVSLLGLSMFFSNVTNLLLGYSLSHSLYSFLWSLGIMTGGGALIYSGISLKRSGQRFARYMAVIGSNPATHIKTLSKKLGIPVKTVRKDLQKMIDKGMFGTHAYINDDLGYLFETSEADMELQKAKNAAAKKTAKAIEREKAKEEIDQYERVISQIRDVNDRIADEEMSAKIDRLETITREIFRTVKQDPEKRKKIDRFMSYYLPTTLKLLESYSKLEATGLEGDNILQSKQTIENAMDSVVAGFERQLDDLYKSEVLDIETDVDVLTKMMDRDKTASDFKVAEASEDAQTADSRTQFEKDFGVTRKPDGTIEYGGVQAQK